MKVTATELANDSKSVLDRVIQRGESAEVQRHGKSVVEIRRKVGVDREELVRILKKIKFSKTETAELKQAMDAASDVLGYAGGD
jgi:antitoxin (DNA-binding transcriptional repressor) of toxin-antitoxin stability system